MMKKIFLYMMLSVLPAAGQAAFEINGVRSVGAVSRMDTLFVVQATAGGNIVYAADDGMEHSYVWYSYSTGNDAFFELQRDNAVETSLPLMDAASQGYMLEIDAADSLYVWVFGHDKYPVVFSGISVDDESGYCDFISVKADISAEPLIYYPRSYQEGVELPRSYELCFDSVYFSTDTYVYERVEQTVDGSGQYDVDAPLDDTSFTLKGDCFDLAFGTADSIESEVYTAKAVELHALASVRIREDATNELDRGEPSESTETVVNLEGSAPLNVEILNYSSPAVTRDGYSEWCVSSDNSFQSCMFSLRSPDFRYTFEEQGTYYVRLQVSNNSPSDNPDESCMQGKIYQIDVLSSSLDVPNVFTPNGDGMNDEFRVAYKSLISFHGVIYNVWGRKVFEWTDPATGWDGTIDGKPAAEGVYYYVIEATGDDYDDNGNRKTYGIRGDINLLR